MTAQYLEPALRWPGATGDLGRLTRREQHVLSLMALGYSNAALSSDLVLSPKTIEGHVHRIYTKLDLPPDEREHRRVLAVLRFLGA